MVIPPSLWIPYITYSWYINPISRENGRPQSEKTHGAWPKPSHFFVFRSITTNIPINPMKSPCSPWFFRQIPWNPKKNHFCTLVSLGNPSKVAHVSPPAGLCCSSERPLERSAGSSHSAGLGSWGTEWVDFNGFYLFELNKLKLISDWTYGFYLFEPINGFYL